jgi:hypothetical protein
MARSENVARYGFFRFTPETAVAEDLDSEKPLTGTNRPSKNA